VCAASQALGRRILATATVIGAGCRDRTRDIQFTKLALYQLS
jgi:hypothetical protein